MSIKIAEFMQLTQERVNKFMTKKLSTLPEQPQDLKEAMDYALLLGGKRARPFLVYATGRAFKGDFERLDYAAAAIEAIHSYSLIHDDMPEMDNDLLRRGKPSVHAKFGAACALLTGDTLQALAFDFISDPKFKCSPALKVRLCQLLAKNSGYQGMCGGQALDLKAENQVLNQQELEHLHALKTGALITTAVQMGFLIAQDDIIFASEQNTEAVSFALNYVESLPFERDLKALQQYGAKVGLAFQVWDDVLDVIGDTEVLGKQVGADESLQKSTFVKLLGVEKAQQYAITLASEAKDALSGIKNDVSLLRDFADFCVNRKF